jgi:hypothetical protein
MGERSKAMFFFQYFDFAKVAIFSGGGGAKNHIYTKNNFIFPLIKFKNPKIENEKHTHTHFCHPFCLFFDKNFESKLNLFWYFLRKSENFNIKN